MPGHYKPTGMAVTTKIIGLLMAKVREDYIREMHAIIEFRTFFLPGTIFKTLNFKIYLLVRN
jgi:hypothetical protein